jgi:hypothetical protein
MKHLSLLLGVAYLLATACPGQAEPLAAEYLYSGKLSAGSKALEKHLADKSADDEARFGLGVVQFVQSFENLGRRLYKHGLRTSSTSSFVPPRVSKLFPENPNPEKLSYAGLRKLVQAFADDLNRADATLAKVKDDKVKLPLSVGKIKIDLFGTGQPVSAASLFEALGMTNESKAAEAFLIKFDRGDVCWARGYVNMMAAWCEVMLALDGQELFETTAHRFFLKVESPHTFLAEEDDKVGPDPAQLIRFPLIADAVSFFYQMLDLPVKEPARFKVALAHLETTVAEGKQMWKHILAETGDDHEWIPNPKQTGVLGVKVTKEMVDSWLGTLDEVGQILEGKKLLPFWRGKPGTRGVNLRKAFLNPPKRLDVVRWVQGPAAAPYVEKGTITSLSDPRTITRLNEVFGGTRFFGFALWFN